MSKEFLRTTKTTKKKHVENQLENMPNTSGYQTRKIYGQQNYTKSVQNSLQ